MSKSSHQRTLSTTTRQRGRRVTAEKSTTSAVSERTFFARRDVSSCEADASSLVRAEALMLGGRTRSEESIPNGDRLDGRVQSKGAPEADDPGENAHGRLSLLVAWDEGR